MTAEKLSTYIRLPYVNLISNPPLLISMTSNSSGPKHENSLRKPRRKVGKTMSTNTKTNTIWRIIRKISRKPQPTTLKHLTKKTNRSNYKKRYSRCTSWNIFRKFFSQKLQYTNQRNKDSTNNSEKYNLPFTPAELKEAIQTSHNTAVGQDEIHYEFLKHFTKNSLNYLLKMFNDIWINGTFPESWKIATVIPISKLGKDNSNPANYHSIALTCCLCKTMECLVSKRLVWYLESNKLITNSHCGFRKRWSTMDHVVKLETSMR